MTPLSPSAEGYRTCPINTGVLSPGGCGAQGPEGKKGGRPIRLKVKLGQTLTQNYQVTSNSSPGYAPNNPRTGARLPAFPALLTTAKGGNDPSVHQRTDRHTIRFPHDGTSFSYTMAQHGRTLKTSGQAEKAKHHRSHIV